jgi:hypothetical protein
MKSTGNKRGMAILITLMLLSLLLALVGAFLTVNRAGNRLVMGSLERRQAQDAALTAFHYAWFHLDQDRNWGHQTRGPLSGGPIEYPAGRATVQLTMSQAGSDGVVDGLYSPSGNFSNPIGTFQMRVRNNLGSRGNLPGVVPKRAIGIMVDAEVGGIKRRLQALLRAVPQAHEGIAAGRDLNLDETSGLVRIASNDPYVNRIAAGRNLNLPFNSNVRFLKHGVAASSGRLELGGTNLASASDAAILAAGEVSGGTFSPNQPTLEVTEFQGDDFALPANRSNLPGGTWLFGDITASQYRPHTVDFREQAVDARGVPIVTPQGQPVYNRGTVARAQRRQSLYNVLTAPNGEQWAAGTAIPGSSGAWEPPDPGMFSSEADAMAWGYDPDAEGGFGSEETSLATSDVHAIRAGLKANVVTGQFVIRSGYRMVSNGDFIVQGEGDRKPELYFGYNMTPGGVAIQESLNGPNGIESAQDNPDQYMGAIIANGDINVVGGVLGYGTMVAGGNLNVKASSGLRTAPGLGVVLKGQRVVIDAATEPEPALPGEPVDIDYTYFHTAIVNSGMGWGNLNTWLDHDLTTRGDIVNSLSSRSTGASPSALWSALESSLGEGVTPPNFSGWPNPANLDSYVRMKEYYQTVATGYNGGDGDPRWLDFSDRQVDAAGRIAGTLDTIAYWADSYKITFQDYLTNPGQRNPDMFLEGLVFAEDDVLINAIGKSVKLKGTVVARDGDVTVSGATKIDIVYDRGLLDDLYDGDDGSTKLEKVFLTFD